MPDQLPDDEKSERLYRLQDKIDRHQAAFHARCRGGTFDVLFEKTGRHPGQIVGRSPYLQAVQVMAPAELIGEIAAVTVTDVSANSLFAALASEASGQRGNSTSSRAGHSPEAGSSARGALADTARDGRTHPPSSRAAMLAEG
jgi:hypothetical protein